MKKSLLTITAFCLTLTLCMPAFAAGADTAGTAVTAPVSLSLDAAKEKIKTSPQMEAIELQALADKTIATGAYEALNTIEDTLDMLKLAEQYSLLSDSAIRTARSEVNKASKPQIEMLKSFAKKMQTPNDTARKNALNKNIVSNYYTLKMLEQKSSIAADNYNITKQLYDQTVLKNKVGTASKMDVLTAESNLNTAKDSKIAAANDLAQYQMYFNIYFGYNVNQKVTLTTAITEVALPTKTLDTSIKEALVNRNEIAEAKYSYDLAKLQYGSVSAYPHTSAAYLAQRAAFLSAELNYKTINDQIELDVRTKYMDMTENYELVKSGKTSESNAAETLRLARLQYDNGLCTLTTVNQANLGYYAAQLSYESALLNYNLAVMEYNYCSQVGTKAAALQ